MIVSPPVAAVAASTATITGTVTLQGGSAVVGVAVTATDPGGTATLFGPALADASGFYTLLVNVGSYDLHFAPPAESGLTAFTATNVQALSDQVVNVVLVPAPPPTHTVLGTVVDASGNPVVGAYVWNNASGTSATSTDGNGHYSITAVAGTYSLTVSIPPISPFGASWSIGPSTPIDLSTADVVQNLRLPSRVNLTIVVRDANGNPVSGSIAGVGHGSTTLLAGDPTTFPTSQVIGPTINGSVTVPVVNGLSFTGTSVPNGLCLLYQNQGYCASPFTVNGDTTILIQMQPPVPPAPGQPTAPTPTNAAPDLHWTDVLGAVNYRVFRDGLEISTTSTPSFVDRTLTHSGTYSYAVAAINANGQASAASPPLVVTYDVDPPVVDYILSPPANSAGWNNADVSVTFTCADALAGIATCPDPVLVSAEGADHAVAGTAVDRAGNATSTTIAVNLDKTAPVLGPVSWTANPKPVGSSATLTVAATDALSGIVSGEYYLDTDPGIGQGIPMSDSGGNLAATIGTNLAAGAYQVGVRGQDAAGNWSSLTTTILVVFDPSISVGITGKNKKDLVPSLANGDVLPGLVNANQTDPVEYGFTADYVNGGLDPRNDLMIVYNTGNQCNSPHPQNCHTFTVSATSFEWLVIDQTNNSRGRFQGVASVTVDGVTTTNPFTVEGVDGDRLTPTGDDQVTIKIYASGANPASSNPLYQVHGSLAHGNSVRIR